jgi:hypothetical protein
MTTMMMMVVARQSEMNASGIIPTRQPSAMPTEPPSICIEHDQQIQTRGGEEEGDDDDDDMWMVVYQSGMNARGIIPTRQPSAMPTDPPSTAGAMEARVMRREDNYEDDHRT